MKKQQCIKCRGELDGHACYYGNSGPYCKECVKTIVGSAGSTGSSNARHISGVKMDVE